jgi:acyl-CoA synthetase (NDP forming)
VFHNKHIGGNRMAGVSGAGFETVGLADYTETGGFSLEMAAPTAKTVQRLGDILAAKKLDGLMEVRNPFDINPGADDEAHVQCVEAFAADPNVDAVVVGLDPIGPMTRTLAESARPGFNIYDEASAVQQLPKLVSRIDKPVIGIVEGGPLYEPMVENLMDQGVCTFRSCEQGVRALAKYTEARLNAERIRADTPTTSTVKG